MDMKSYTMPTEEQLHKFFDHVNRAHDGTHREQIWIGLLKTGRRLCFGQQKLMDTFDITRDQAVNLMVTGIACNILNREGTQVIIPAQKMKLLLHMIQGPEVSEDKQEQLDEAGEE